MPVNSEIFRIYRHLFYGSPLKKDSFLLLGHLNNIAADKMLLPNMKRRLD